jgi:carbon-monoxide dehydrogenase medium subunit
MASGIGNARVRAAGTVGGNLAFAEPRSDWLPMLSALDADIHLARSSGERTMKFNDFLTGPYGTAMEPDEILTGISIATGSIGRVHHTKVKGAERPLVAATIAEVGDGWRMAVGAVGEEILLVHVARVEDFDPEELAQSADVVPDHSAGEEYRRHLVAVVIKRCLRAVLTSTEGRKA